MDSPDWCLSVCQFSQLYKAGHRNPTQYTFQHVFDTESEQKEVFDRLCVPMVEDVLRGKNGKFNVLRDASFQ